MLSLVQKMVGHTMTDNEAAHTYTAELMSIMHNTDFFTACAVCLTSCSRKTARCCVLLVFSAGTSELCQLLVNPALLDEGGNQPCCRCRPCVLLGPGRGNNGASDTSSPISSLLDSNASRSKMLGHWVQRWYC